MLTGLSMPEIASLAALAVLLDLLLGETRRWHPLVGFGRGAAAIERALNRGGYRFLRGALAWSLAVVPPVALTWWLVTVVATAGMIAAAVLHVALLYFCLGLRSLHDHTAPIEQALRRNDLAAARASTARIVSRDTGAASGTDLAKAGVESLLENGNDAVFGALFWFAVGGAPGALLFRLANTLDAMWGYRNPRYLAFGRSAARIDDGLNWIPARLTALSYALLGNTRQAWRCWRTQAPQWPSPNAGPVMAAGAGALELALGGAAVYDGVLEQRPALGSGRCADPSDIGRAWRLVLGTAGLWLGIFALLAAATWFFERGMHA